MSERRQTTRPLRLNACQSVCVWTATAEVMADDPQRPSRVFRCEGCGSEWVRSELWTPIDADGVVPADVAAERDLAATSDRAEDAAGKSDTCRTSDS